MNNESETHSNKTKCDNQDGLVQDISIEELVSSRKEYIYQIYETDKQYDSSLPVISVDNAFVSAKETIDHLGKKYLARNYKFATCGLYSEMLTVRLLFCRITGNYEGTLALALEKLIDSYEALKNE